MQTQTYTGSPTHTDAQAHRHRQSQTYTGSHTHTDEAFRVLAFGTVIQFDPETLVEYRYTQNLVYSGPFLFFFYRKLVLVVPQFDPEALV